MNTGRVLFLGSRNHEYCLKACDFCGTCFGDVTICLGEWGDPFPEEAQRWSGDYVLSFLSRWIVPPSVLSCACHGALNFHPAPPEYPGIGCTNFALYDDVSHYGVTCHHMTEKVDSGNIVAVSRFAVSVHDTVATLLERSHKESYVLFQEIVQKICAGEPLPQSREVWGKKVYTRQQLDALMEITPEMSHREIRRRVRACSYGRWKPFVTLGDYRFVLDERNG